jgi:choline kinase
MSVDHLVCAAGEGARFRHLFGTLPKPLIRLRGATLLEWAIRSLPIAVGDRLVVVVQRRHGIRQRIATSLDATPAGPVVWIELDRPTRGQLETALTALEVLGSTSRNADDERHRSLAIFNCDTFFESDTLAAAMTDPTLAGVLPCAQEPGDAWSFCAVDARDRVVRIAEKKRVGPWATAGFYFFRPSTRSPRRARRRPDPSSTSLRSTSGISTQARPSPSTGSEPSSRWAPPNRSSDTGASRMRP